MCEVLHLVKNNLMCRCLLGAAQLESSFVENHLGVLVDKAEHKPEMCHCHKEG